MEKDNKTVSAEDLGINPPAESRITTMFNNMGTGVMVGGALPFAINMIDEIRKKPHHLSAETRGKYSIIFAVCGAAIGAVFGEIEGRRLQNYRYKVSNKIAEQEQRIAQLEAQTQNAPTTWVDKQAQAPRAKETALG
jgi:hypothetical protein